MVQAVASRLVPRARVSKALVREAAEEASRVADLAEHAGAPASISRIPTRASGQPSKAGAFIRPLGNSRRVFLLNPYLDAEEMEGLAFRIRALAANSGINSVLIATDNTDDVANNCLPSHITKLKNPDYGGLDVDMDPEPDQTWHVAGGIDYAELVRSGKYKDMEYVDSLLTNIQELAKATRGTPGKAKVPAITFPHGAVTDGGYAFCMGSYVIATPQTSFSIMNPSRGLSFDPIGLSYVLNRLGDEQRTPQSSQFAACGMILALTGFHANAIDMVQTGLVTHTTRSVDTLPILEQSLATLMPWDQQGLVKKPKHYYGMPRPADNNAEFRNLSVAYTINQISEYSADSRSDVPLDYFNLKYEDPADDLDSVPWESAFISSDLVNYAETFKEIFLASTVVEVMEGLKKVAGAADTEDADEMEGILVARDLLNRMERQSPLALSVVYQLMRNGRRPMVSLEDCMKTEKRAIASLLQKEDFKAWASGMDGLSKPVWKHKNITEVSKDEVAEIIGGGL